MAPPPTHSDFRDFFAELLSEYEEWELPRLILLQFPSLGSHRSQDELAVLAEQTFAVVHQRPTENMEKVSQTGWRNIALHAVASLQRKALELFKRGKNPGWIILLSGQDVAWVTNPARCAELCAQQQVIA